MWFAIVAEATSFFLVNLHSRYVIPNVDVYTGILEREKACYEVVGVAVALLQLNSLFGIRINRPEAFWTGHRTNILRDLWKRACKYTTWEQSLYTVCSIPTRYSRTAFGFKKYLISSPWYCDAISVDGIYLVASNLESWSLVISREMGPNFSIYAQSWRYPVPWSWNICMLTEG